MIQSLPQFYGGQGHFLNFLVSYMWLITKLGARIAYLERYSYFLLAFYSQHKMFWQRAKASDIQIVYSS